ncbi:hypothetical protein FDZ71_00555 [bacterium]|nr:MAG: hypothetical protein FDZ71_00555 [bacterium]
MTPADLPVVWVVVVYAATLWIYTRPRSTRRPDRILLARLGQKPVVVSRTGATALTMFTCTLLALIVPWWGTDFVVLAVFLSVLAALLGTPLVLAFHHNWEPRWRAVRRIQDLQRSGADPATVKHSFRTEFLPAVYGSPSRVRAGWFLVALMTIGVIAESFGIPGLPVVLLLGALLLIVGWARRRAAHPRRAE